MGKGKLFIISTPIGNLEDITYRAVKTLKEVDLIAAEDTRRTRKLLSRYDIHSQMISYHDHNKIGVSKKLLNLLISGKNVGLVSDAGTPCISDPGFYLIRKILESNIELISIPGPSAVLAALTVAGLPTDRFVFEGFLPVRKGKRTKKLEDLSMDTRTLVFFESPYRIASTLEEIYSIFGDRKVVVAREMTKMYEEIMRFHLEDIASTKLKGLKGEITLIVEGKHKKK